MGLRVVSAENDESLINLSKKVCGPQGQESAEPQRLAWINSPGETGRR
jgi:hypothetical protein